MPNSCVVSRFQDNWFLPSSSSHFGPFPIKFSKVASTIPSDRSCSDRGNKIRPRGQLYCWSLCDTRAALNFHIATVADATDGLRRCPCGGANRASRMTSWWRFRKEERLVLAQGFLVDVDPVGQLLRKNLPFRSETKKSRAPSTFLRIVVYSPASVFLSTRAVLHHLGVRAVHRHHDRDTQQLLSWPAWGTSGPRSRWRVRAHRRSGGGKDAAILALGQSGNESADLNERRPERKTWEGRETTGGRRRQQCVSSQSMRQISTRSSHQQCSDYSQEKLQLVT